MRPLQETLLILGYPQILPKVCDKLTLKIFYPLVKISFDEHDSARTDIGVVVVIWRIVPHTPSSSVAWRNVDIQPRQGILQCPLLRSV